MSTNPQTKKSLIKPYGKSTDAKANEQTDHNLYAQNLLWKGINRLKIALIECDSHKTKNIQGAE